MIIAAHLILTIQLLVLAYGIMLLGKAFKEKNLANKIAGFILVIGTTLFFVCTVCHTVKIHKHHKSGFRGQYGKHECEWSKGKRGGGKSYGEEKLEEADD
ncbi:MAG: hypothetical protein DRQ88_06790 [Epsilonproteobacteria bacterium]|nr:MAG: hypothetical protein DRQ89_05800 [Campylobacterota bacterium]RLA66341.1 MAG: hypothetical protein DRQ88_06790 [Campylobacterota bacterium]